MNYKPVRDIPVVVIKHPSCCSISGSRWWLTVGLLPTCIGDRLPVNFLPKYVRCCNCARIRLLWCEGVTVSCYRSGALIVVSQRPPKVGPGATTILLVIRFPKCKLFVCNNKLFVTSRHHWLDRSHCLCVLSKHTCKKPSYCFQITCHILNICTNLTSVCCRRDRCSIILKTIMSPTHCA